MSPEPNSPVSNPSEANRRPAAGGDNAGGDATGLDFTEIPVTSLHRRLGAIPRNDGSTRFGVWAPEREQIEVELVDSGRLVSMRKVGPFHVAVVDDAPAGTLYRYRIDGEVSRPDPASRFQPHGVHGPSQVCGTDFEWHDAGWRGVDRESWVIYELHVGTFTDEGTFVAAIGRLDELVELGINVIELMPVADSAGRWNWGYDGVGWFAPRRTFGTPDDLRRLVDAAHARGVAVVLDVVYNHFGPEGNYWGDFGSYLSDRHTTAWGPAPNFDDPVHGEGVKRFVVANAIHWYDEYHLDGLRVDAIHCMIDDSDPHVVRRLGEAVDAWSRETGRPAALIAESNVYDPEMLVPPGDGGMGFTAQWCDDFLHSVFATVRPGEQLTDREYHPGSDLARTLRAGFVHRGTCREPLRRVDDGDRVEMAGLVYSIQNHDFIGNHPLGKRFHQISSADTQRAAAALLILSPAIPMLFMGEEFACDRSFLFFVDFQDERLRRAVVEGRRAEYPQHDWSAGMHPTDPAAHEASRIGPSHHGDQAMRRWYRSLIAMRRRWLESGLLHGGDVDVRDDLEAGLFEIRYRRLAADGGEAETGIVFARLAADESAAACPLEVPASAELVLDSRQRATPRTELLPNHAKVFVRSIRSEAFQAFQPSRSRPQ